MQLFVQEPNENVIAFVLRTIVLFVYLAVLA